MLRVAEFEALSDTGRQRRHNEDRYYARSPVFAVADGMGGAQAGEVASTAAVDTLAGGVPDGPGSAEERLAEAVRRANERIHAMSREDEGRAGMGTTMTAAHVGETDVALAHVGDSRAYRLREDNLERLTEDHSLVEEMRRRGQLTAEEADEHPQRSIITRALGPEPAVRVDTSSWRALPGDVYLLCSDGLTSMVGEARIGEVLRSARSLREAGERLITEANAAGGRDNITVVLFRLEEVTRAGAADDEQPTASHEPVTAEHATVEHGAQATRVRPSATAARRAQSATRAPRARRRGLALALTGFLLVPLLLGAYIAVQAVYFVGADPSGFIALYRGLPYELPLGVNLYERTYLSGVRADALPPARRERLLDHQLRSKDSATLVLRDLERGQAQAVGK